MLLVEAAKSLTNIMDIFMSGENVDVMASAVYLVIIKNILCSVASGILLEPNI